MHHAANFWRNRIKAGETNDARIINTSSPSGIFGNVGQTNYGAAKAAIMGMTFVWAIELGKYGITVNAMSPAGCGSMNSSQETDLTGRVRPLR